MRDKIIPKSYGSIPHLSISKMSQQADKKIEKGQEKLLTEKVRDFKDLIIITEKIDGTNVGVIKQNGRIIPIIRSGYECDNSFYEQHHYFAKFVFNHIEMFDWLPEGWRICGEWCIQAHGTLYDITKESPFCAFDIIDDKNERILYLIFLQLCSKYNIPIVKLLHIGSPVSIKNAIKLLGNGYYGNPEKPEGVVYRLERNGKVEFLAKYVRSDKEDGKYLKDNLILYNNGFIK